MRQLLVGALVFYVGLLGFTGMEILSFATAEAAPLPMAIPAVMVVDVTGDCVTVIYEDEDAEGVNEFQTVLWTDLDLLDTSKQAVVIRVFQDRGLVPPSASFEFSLHWNSSFEVVSLRTLGPNTNLLARGTGNSPSVNEQILAFGLQEGGGQDFKGLPLVSRHTSHASSEVMFFMIQDSDEIDEGQARTDIGPCPTP